MMLKFATRTAWILGISLSGAAAAQAPGNGVHALTTFTNGTEDWGALFQSYPPDLGDNLVDVGGSHGIVLQHVWESFGVSLRNERNRDFLGDYTRLGQPLRFSFDERNVSIDFFGVATSRNYHLQFLKHVGNGHIGVSYALDYVAPAHGWVTHHVLFDSTSNGLPPGWIGFDQYGGRTLPAGYTFTDILRDVDMVRITTLEPGYAYLLNGFGVMFDNITLQSVAVHQGDGPLAE
jgi:hypothetical protein